MRGYNAASILLGPLRETGVHAVADNETRSKRGASVGHDSASLGSIGQLAVDVDLAQGIELKL